MYIHNAATQHNTTQWHDSTPPPGELVDCSPAPHLACPCYPPLDHSMPIHTWAVSKTWIKQLHLPCGDDDLDGRQLVNHHDLNHPQSRPVRHAKAIAHYLLSPCMQPTLERRQTRSRLLLSYSHSRPRRTSVQILVSLGSQPATHTRTCH